MSFAAVFGKILQVGGSVSSGVGTLEQGRATAAQYEFSAAEDLNNAELAKQDQMIAAEAGAVERQNIAKEAHVQRGAQRTSFAAANVLLDEGTPLELDIMSRQQEARETIQSKEQQALDIHRLETERQGLIASAGMKRKAARVAKKASRQAAGGQMLETVGGMIGSMGGKK